MSAHRLDLGDVAQDLRHHILVIEDATVGQQRQFEAEGEGIERVAIFEPFHQADERVEAIQNGAQGNRRALAPLKGNGVGDGRAFLRIGPVRVPQVDRYAPAQPGQQIVRAVLRRPKRADQHIDIEKTGGDLFQGLFQAGRSGRQDGGIGHSPTPAATIAMSVQRGAC